MSALALARYPADPPVAPQALVDLAHDRSDDARQRLLMGVAALCDAQRPTEAVSSVLGEIFLTLARQAERDVRKALSERLASADWAPRALVNVLALDEIEIARPILALSPVLQDEDLLAVLVQATLEHQIAVARRPNLGGRVADAIIDQAQPAALTALASNRTADIGGDSMRRLVEHSRRIAALRSPLTRHPRLNEQLASQMYQWVGEALRQSICARFAVDEQKLRSALQQSVDDVAWPTRPAPTAIPDAERDEHERRLIDKLMASKQLRPGYLVRAVREKRLGLFIHGLSALSGEPVTRIRAAIAAPSPQALYLACAAVEIDRAVFPGLLEEIRALNGGLPGTEGGSVLRYEAISPAAASRSLRALAAS